MFGTADKSCGAARFITLSNGARVLASEPSLSFSGCELGTVSYGALLEARCKMAAL